MEFAQSMVEKGTKALLNPPRLFYSLSDLYKPQILNCGLLTRTDFLKPNRQGFKLACSLYEIANSRRQKLFLFLHGNSGTRLDCVSLVRSLCQNGLLCWDFAGCGMSEGQGVTMGVLEVIDLQVMLNYAREELKYQKLYLWGRSMGAVTVLKYLQNYKNLVQGAVIDSPFSDLKTLVCQIITQRTLIPELITKPLVNYLFQKIKQQRGLDLSQSQVLQNMYSVKTPLALIYSQEDKLVNCKHSQLIYQRCLSTKKSFKIAGGHNDIRSQTLVLQVIQFIKGTERQNLILSNLRQSSRGRGKNQRGLSLKMLETQLVKQSRLRESSRKRPETFIRMTLDETRTSWGKQDLRPKEFIGPQQIKKISARLKRRRVGIS